MTSHHARESGPRRFQPYPQYKDSGVEWLGEIPAHWEAKRLKYVAPVTDERSHTVTSDLPYIGLEDIESGTGRLARTSESASTEGEEAEGAASLFRPGDVLFGKLRPYLAKVLRPDFEGRCSTELLVLRSAGEIAPSVLAYQLLSRDFIGWVDAMTYGTKMPRANPDQVMNIPVALASAQEQRAIAAFLDRETAKIDALVAGKERLIELLQEKRTALITRAVTKGLPAAAAAQAGLDPNVPMKDSGIEWLGEIPVHWRESKVKYLARYINGYPFNPEDWDVEGLPIIRIQNLTNPDAPFNRFAGSIDRRYKISRGDILISWSASLGLYLWSSDEDAWVNQHIFKVAILGNVVDRRFFVWLGDWFVRELKKETHGSTMTHLTDNVFGRFQLYVPPMVEQTTIAAFLDRETAKIDALVAKNERLIELLEEKRTALISAAVTGKIDVREHAA